MMVLLWIWLKLMNFMIFLLSNLDTPFSLLINKIHSYSYNFNAQRVIGDLKGLDKVSVFISDAGGLMSTETLIDMNRNSNWDIKIFREREEAVAWLMRLKKEVS